jgi:hypothetical protein
MFRLLGLLLPLTLLEVVVSAQTASPFSKISEHLSDLGQITGLKQIKKVEYDLLDRAGLKPFLDQRVKEELKPDEIRLEELMLKKLGLLPADYQLAPAMIALMAEQAEAFYDYREKKLFLIEGEDGPMQQAALVHELAHALADQHFHLEKFIKRGTTDDSALARAAVMEGQATWLMYEWMASKAGQSLRTSPALARMLNSRSGGGMGGQFPVLNSAPLYLRASLLFPYAEGLQFQQAVVEKLGNAGFSEVFLNPPATSQQVMHPEKYFAKASPVQPKLPGLVKQSNYKEVATATMGEFDHAILIQQYGAAETADELAPKWRGGLVRLLEHKKDKTTVLVYASEWESPGAAKEMFAAYRKALQGKWKSVSYVNEGEASVSGTGEDGHFLVRLDGTRVTSIEGLKSPADVDLSR